MKCRRCEGRAPDVALRDRARSRTVWGADRISGLHCTICGTLLDAEDIAQLLLEKQSQLERFGLLPLPASASEPHVAVAAHRLFRLKKH